MAGPRRAPRRRAGEVRPGGSGGRGAGAPLASPSGPRVPLRQRPPGPAFVRVAPGCAGPLPPLGAGGRLHLNAQRRVYTGPGGRSGAGLAASPPPPRRGREAVPTSPPAHGLCRLGSGSAPAASRSVSSSLGLAVRALQMTQVCSDRSLAALRGWGWLAPIPRAWGCTAPGVGCGKPIFWPRPSRS